jgi:amino acid transporter
MKENRKITWQALTLMAFTTVWSFGNIVNGYANQGLHIVISWLLMFGLYFIPYTLMVGEMGATFREGQGGVSSWIRSTCSARLAYLAGWTYWIVHVPYLAQKPQSILIAFGWAYWQDGGVVNKMAPIILQSACLLVFFFFLWFASRGINSLKKIGAVAGASMFVMSILYVVLALAAPAITDAHTQTIAFTWDTFMPTFDFDYFTTLAILVFAVGGCEKLSPYINTLEKPSRDFPRGMICMTVMVAITALLGSLAMGLMFDTNNIPKDLMMNGAYYCFQKLGDYYGVGSLFLIIYAIANALGQMAALSFSIDAPIKILLADVDHRFIPESFSRVNKNGTPVNGYKLTALLVGIIIIVPTLGIGDMTSLFNWLMRLNAVVMPLRYLWVFVAYMALKRAAEGLFTSQYHFTRNRVLGFIVGGWCFAFTAFACLMGMFPRGIEAYTSEWCFQLALNILTPMLLLGIGLIFPKLTGRKA